MGLLRPALFALLALTGAATAHAHSSSNAYIALQPGDNALLLRADVHLRDADLVLDLDTDRDTEHRITAFGGQVNVGAIAGSPGQRGDKDPSGAFGPPVEQPAQGEAEHEEQDADDGPLAACGARPCGEQADARGERQRVGERAVPVRPLRIIAHAGQRVDEQAELLEHLGDEEGDPPERVRHGRATFSGGDPTGEVKVGQQCAAGADRRADRDLQR